MAMGPGVSYPIMAKSSRLHPNLRVSHLTIDSNIEPSTGKSNQHGQWLVRCDCGNTKVVTGRYLYSVSVVKSCGCKVSEARANGAASGRRFEHTTTNWEYSIYRRASRDRGYAPLSRREWEDIVFKPCHYCGGIDIRGYPIKRRINKLINMTAEDLARYKVPMNAIDRVDSNIGYESGNMVPCCGMCNVMKMAFAQEAFLDKVAQICRHRSLDINRSDTRPESTPRCIRIDTTQS